MSAPLTVLGVALAGRGGGGAMTAQHDLAMTWGAELARDRAEAYAAGRRDGIAVAQHQHALARDLLRALDARMREALEQFRVTADERALDRAYATWVAAGRPGLEGDDGC